MRSIRYRETVLTALIICAFTVGSAVAQVCVGDCSGDKEVTVNELIAMVNVALGTVEVASCVPGDANSDGTISINEIISGVNNALNGCGATPTPTPTPGGSPSYVGDYFGSAGSYGVRFHVGTNGAASGFLDFLGSAIVTIGGEGQGGAGAAVLASYAASGQANLETGAYQLAGEFFENPFDFAGQLPAAPNTSGTLSVTVFGATSEGALNGGTPPPGPTPTPTPGCNTASLQMTFSNVSGDFSGIASNFVVSRMNTAIEDKAPSYIAGLHEVYNSTFNGPECTQEGARLRNIQISLFEVEGGLAAGQSLSLGNNAIVYYGEEGSGGDRVWSSSAGTVFIDAVNGSVVTLRVVGAAMTVPAGAASGSFTLDVTGQVNNFMRR